MLLESSKIDAFKCLTFRIKRVLAVHPVASPCMVYADAIPYRTALYINQYLSSVSSNLTPNWSVVVGGLAYHTRFSESTIEITSIATYSSIGTFPVTSRQSIYIVMPD